MHKRNCSLVGVGLMAMLLLGCTREAAHPQASSASPGQSASAARVVHLYNWADYIDPAVVTDFERTTGIKVTQDVFDSQDMLETKLLTGVSGYDVAVVASDKLSRLVAAGVLQKLDYTLLPSSRNLDPELHAALARIDPANAAAMPMIDEALRTDPNVYPSAEVRAKLVSLRARTQEESRLENRVWTRFRTGQ